MTRFIALVFLLLLPVVAIPATVTEAPVEARIRDVASMLRCPVCQSENILDSQASTAKEMVVILRERIAEGMTDEQIFTFFKSRYGDYVLLSPPTNGVARVIWLVPFALVASGALAFALMLVRARQSAAKTHRRDIAPLTEASLKELDL